jgi:hypothetical protein
MDVRTPWVDMPEERACIVGPKATSGHSAGSVQMKIRLTS